LNPDEHKFDVIVVGTGPGGATVAKELSQRGKKVLMLEWGDYAPLTGTFGYAFKHLLFPGKGMLFTNQMLGLVRGIDTGGSTVFYYGIYFPVPIELFKSYNIDLAAEEEELRKELPIAPLKEEMIGPMTRRIMDSAQNLGYDWQKLDKIMYQDKWKPEFEFSHYGDRYNIKWSARMYVAEALTSGAVIINKAKVGRIIFDNKTAVGVEYKKERVNTKVFAPLTILSAGGIGTPLILRASGIKGAGYDFFFDPLIGVRGTTKDIDVPLFEIPMSTGILMKEEGYLMADMAHPAATLGIFASQVFRFDQLFSRRHTLQIIVKAKDTLSGHLTDKGGVRKKLIKEDKQKLLKGYDRAKEILKNAGAKNIFKTWYLAAHPGGTAKIGEIVDSNLKTEYDNLYVCDCSVIPEAWGLPPVATILALGKRLAKHLSNR
jgi:choline dehydrogenase-like flavoprotein